MIPASIFLFLVLCVLIGLVVKSKHKESAGEYRGEKIEGMDERGGKAKEFRDRLYFQYKTISGK